MVRLPTGEKTKFRVVRSAQAKWILLVRKLSVGKNFDNEITEEENVEDYSGDFCDFSELWNFGD